MNNWIIVPTILPAMTAALLVLALRHDLVRQRIVSIAASILLLAVAIGLFVLASDGETRGYYLGNWPAPFGIVLALDRLSATMLLLTALLGLAVVLYAICGLDAKGRHFHALFQFQLLGVNGAFLTGDVFNLFVFFEVMLIASYGLMLHGGGAERLKAGFHYVAINLIGSTVFLFAVGLIYAVTGTLNMADLAVKVAAAGPSNQALLQTGAVLLLAVFATKAALVPLHWWLPTAYAATSAAAAAMFMIMTKVGAYSMIRVFGMAFGADAGALAYVAAPYVLPAALVTLVLGSIGMLASRTMRELICFSIVASMGTLLIAVGLFETSGLSAALYYMLHSTLAGAALFLLADLIGRRRGPAGDRLTPAPAIVNGTLLGGLFFAAAIAMVGMPPLSGFLGKLMILDATRDAPASPWIWAAILGSSLIMMLSFARTGSVLFWNTREDAPGEKVQAEQATSSVRTLLPILVVAALVGLTALLALAAGPTMRTLDATALQALDTESYVRAILGPDARLTTAGSEP